MRWCEGLPELRERPLRADERAAVARLARGLAWRIAGRLALAGAAPLVAFGLVVLAVAVVGVPDAEAGPARQALEGAGAIAFLAGFLVGPAAALLAARDRWRDLRRVREDRAVGIAVEFGEGSRALAVLPASGRVLARDGRPADLAARARIGAAVPPPPEAPTYAISAGGLGADGDAREIMANGLVRRPLSPAERDELRGHARGLRRIPWTVALVALWWAMGVARWAEGADERTPLVAMLTLVLALGAWRLVRARSLAARLDADAEEGWAIRATAGTTSGDEALPASRAVWTTGGAPARWRTGDQRRR